MNDWYTSIYKGFIISGLVAFIIGVFTQGKTSLGAYISGYSVLTLGIMMILLILFNNILNVSQNSTTLNLLYTILLTTGPFLLMLVVISFILYLMITYKNNIINNRVSKGYYSFSNISVLLLFIQLYIVYTNITTDKFETTGKISKVTSSIIYLLSVLTGICAVILFTILKYYTTDGFQNNYKLIESM
jgi:hypothetical protein